MGVRILRTGDSDEWMAILKEAWQYDFHHLPQYHRVAERHGEGIAHLFVYREGVHMIALPLLLRPVDPAEPGGWQDATSVYGYGGPVASDDAVPEAVARNFRTALAETLAERRVVTVFSRLHPLIAQPKILAGLGECLANGTTISIDLTLSDEEQRAQYSKSCRTSIRKLHELGFIGWHDREMEHLDEFREVYDETMRRVGAPSSYCFDKGYFDLFTRELRNVSHLFVALKDGEIAAATLCTICDGIVQDHLGGTRDAFLKFSPDRLVVDTERIWAKEMGARVFHLGGGVGSQQDSVFHYKAGFSSTRHTFATLRWVLRYDIYEELVAKKERWNQANAVRLSCAGFFPAYRCPTIPTGESETVCRTREHRPGIRVLGTEQAGGLTQ
jgi:Acetyltransferase (GNAT) domain